MSTAQLVAILAVAAPALAVVLWPLWRRAGSADAAAAEGPLGRALELEEEKTAILRALREIDFDHDAGHLSDDDHAGLRARYEGRAAQIVTELDRLRPAVPLAPAAPVPPPPEAAAGRPWTRHPATVAAGAVLLLLFGALLGVNAGRFSTPEPPAPMAGPPIPTAPTPPPASALPPGLGGSGAAEAPGAAPRPLSPEMLGGMLEAARQSLVAGRYQEAIAAYQAILKRDSQNVDAMTHLALIVAIGGHADAALETWAKALAVDPGYPPAYLYRGQVLYEVKQDYAGAVRDWERFVSLVPAGADHDRVVALLADARQKRGAR